MRLFSTEAVSKYHPDKYADQISDAILTECLKQDRQSHCGIETMVKGNTVVLGGEITSKADINYCKTRYALPTSPTGTPRAATNSGNHCGKGSKGLKKNSVKASRFRKQR